MSSQRGIIIAKERGAVKPQQYHGLQLFNENEPKLPYYRTREKSWQSIGILNRGALIQRYFYDQKINNI